jgi:hypothetical protein
MLSRSICSPDNVFDRAKVQQIQDKIIKLSAVNILQNSRLTPQVHVDNEVVLSSPLGRLASNPQEHICTRRFELD